MTTLTDEFVAIAQRTQDATNAAVQTWTETTKQYSEHITIENPLPHPAEVHTAVDAWFDLVAGLVTEQRAFTKRLIDAGTETVGTVTDQARAAASAIPAIPANPFVPGAQAPEAPATPAAETPRKTRTSRSASA